MRRENRSSSDEWSGSPVGGGACPVQRQLTARRRGRALQTVLDWLPRWAYTSTAGTRFPCSLISEGETHGFETT
jgi:hypothetical protein